jgi:PPOX class probable F420-dependent enzyme
MASDILPGPETTLGARVRERLGDEVVVWFTTVGADGTPQPNPVWFLWEDNGIVVYNRPDAHRINHVARNPRVALHFDGNGKGGDIVVLAGTATRVTDAPLAHENADYVAKYGPAMARVSGSAAGFGEAYPVVLRVGITKVRGF